jgi:CHAT domain-containing protein
MFTGVNQLLLSGPRNAPSRLRTLLWGVCLGTFWVSSAVWGYATPRDSTLGRHYFELAEASHLDAERYLAYAEQALPYLWRAQLWQPYWQTHLGIAFISFYQSDFERAVTTAREVERLLATTDCPAQNRYDALMGLSRFYHSYGDLERARVFSERALAVSRASRATVINAQEALSSLGVIYRRRGDLYRAIDYYQQALARRGASAPGPYAAVEHNLARCYQFLGRAEADRYFRAAIRTIQQSDASYRNQNLAEYHVNYGLYLLEQDRLAAARSSLRAGLALEDWMQNTTKAQALRYLARVEQAAGREALAGQYFAAAQVQYRSSYPAHHAEQAALELDWAAYNASRGQPDTALAATWRAVLALCPELTAADDPAVIAPAAAAIILDKNTLLRTLDLRARLLLGTGQPEAALTTYTQALRLITDIRRDIQTAESKLLLSERATALFEAAIELAYQRYAATQDDRYLARAFQFAEQNRAGLLLESLLAAEAAGRSEIPADRREAIRRARVDIALYDRTLEQTTDDDVRDRLRRERFLRNEALQQLYRQLERDYPAYYAARYATDPVTAPRVQAYLRDRGEVLYTIFSGTANDYFFYLDGQTLRVQCLVHTSAREKELSAFLERFTQPDYIAQDPAAYAEQAFRIYDRYLGWADPRPGAPLLISPDGAFNFLPFEALLTQAPAGESLAELPYLLRAHRVSYTYSAQWLLRYRPPLSALANPLAIAPLFAAGEQGQPPLRYSRGEFGGSGSVGFDTLIGPAATLAGFRQRVGRAGLLHLSTHAAAPPGVTPRIYFIDSTLLLPELYARRLAADLVVLSACETNLGDFRRGEGVFSLARGFAQAGAGSLIASLWSVNDLSTQLLFQDFYRRLAAGASKATALHEAKLAYLAAAEVPVYRRSPYYWAAFSFIGGDAVLMAPSPFYGVRSWSWAVAVCVLLVFAGWWWRRTRRGRSHLNSR